MQPVIKYIAELKKEGDHTKATVAMKAAAGGIMTPERVSSLWPEHEEVCKCGHWLPDEVHMFWQGRLLKEKDQRTAVTETSWMRERRP